MNKVIEQIEKLKLIPVVTINDISKALPLASALRSGNLPCAEITFRTECAEEAIQAICKKYPEMLIGAGTILTKEQADRAIAAGAKFIVSPGLNPHLVQYCMEHEILIIPGCSNASDIETAIEFGLSVVKFFPAENAGGLPMMKALSAPYHRIRFMPTGGINEKNLRDYLDFDKVIACGGSWMVKENLISGNEFDKIASLCQAAVDLISKGKEPIAPKARSIHSFDTLHGEKEFDALGLGEILMRLSPPVNETISDGNRFLKHTGGAELNVMAGLSLLGMRTGVISKLPHNKLGDFMISEIRKKGVDSTFIQRDESADARAGIYFFEQGASPRKSSVLYDRSHTSFTALSVDEIPQDVFHNTKIFFTSGISMAVSPYNCEQVMKAIKKFKDSGSMIAFDVNYRASLWSEKDARTAIERILPMVDVLFVSEETSRRMFEKTGTLEEIQKSYCSRYGISVIASTKRSIVSPKYHNFGSLAYSVKENMFYSEAEYENIEVVDRIGSGDSYIAGFLFGILKYRDLQKAIEFGNAACAMKNTINGDMPSACLSEIEAIIRDHQGKGEISEMNR